MNTNNHLSKPWLPIAAAVAAALSLSACDKRHDTETAGQKLDRTIAEAKQDSQDARVRADRKMEEVKADSKDAANKASIGLEDSKITAEVKSKLAGDSQLSALDISVNTDHGLVSLTGTAPNEAARLRATTLAGAVDGVRSVDNRLAVSHEHANRS